MFCCKIWGLRATDLNQGIVYGQTTAEMDLDPALATRYDYDQIYGTALNRFCSQAAIEYPLTVYGTGGQTRGYINLKDTVRCIELALLNPAARGEFRVFNQITEQFTLNELAQLVVHTGAELGLNVRADNLPNPRIEAETHYFNAVHTKLEGLGLKPHLLDGAELRAMISLAVTHRDRIDQRLILPTVAWGKSANPEFYEVTKPELVR